MPYPIGFGFNGAQLPGHRHAAAAGGAPVVWGHTTGRREIARGEAVRDDWVRFRLRDDDYRQLAGGGMSAIVTVDGGSGNILSV